jgi:multiple sugar transport system substrate-binding protein
MKTIRAALCTTGLMFALAVTFTGCPGRTPGPPGKTTIVFWHSFVASTIPALQALLADFEREHPTIHIDAQYIPTGDGLIQKLVSSLQTGTAPDISWIHTDFLDQLVEAQAVRPLEPFLRGPDSLSSADIADFFEPLREAGTRHGALYALPMEATSLALLYNKDALREAGLTHPPATWEELVTYSRQLTIDRDGDGRTDQYGFFVPVFPASGELNIWMTLQWTPFLWQAGGVEAAPDGFTVLFDSPAGVRALTLWKTIYDTERFKSFGIAHDLGFASGKLAMILDGPWNLPRYRAMKGISWDVAPLPAGPSGRATYIAGELLAIFARSAHPQEAWTFLRWVVRPDVQARFSISSGYLPVRKSVLARKEYADFLAADPALSTFVRQMFAGRARAPLAAHRVEINRFLAEAIERATVGGEDPGRCLAEAAERSNALLRTRGDHAGR